MSIWIYLEIEIDTGNKPYTPVLYEDNITHNLTGMWDEAGIYDCIYKKENETAGSILPTLKQGFAAMQSNPSKYRALEINNWGTYEDAMTFLENLIQACEDYPKAIIRVAK